MVGDILQACFHAGSRPAYSSNIRAQFSSGVRQTVILIWAGAIMSVAGPVLIGLPDARADEVAAHPAAETTASSSENWSWNPLAWKWTPSDDELQKYRRSWNPMANGPILETGVDIQPKGQFLVQPFFFGEYGHMQYGNHLSLNSTDAPHHVTAVAPTFIFAYGLTDNLELNVIPPGASSLWWHDSKQTAQQQAANERMTTSAFGPGDTTIYLKNRLRVQDPDTWQPTITLDHQLVLPSSQWLGTPGIPGGFSPLGRLPATRFGALSYTEGLLFRKNLQPFRISGGVYYTYTAPGSSGGMNTYVGDIVNTRVVVEYILNDKRGFGFNLEFVTLHELPFRADGHSVNVPTIPGTNAHTLNLFGVEPAVQYKFFQNEHGALVAAAGVLFSVAGQNNIDAMYPNLSIYYYWSKGKVMMR